MGSMQTELNRLLAIFGLNRLLALLLPRCTPAWIPGWIAKG